MSGNPSKLKNIESPTEHDVVGGRGGASYKHPGNVTYRSLVTLNKPLYTCSKKLEKINISRSIVAAIRAQDPPGRFLELDPSTGLWNDIGDKKATEKTSQALREGQPKLRKDLDNLKGPGGGGKKKASSGTTTKKAAKGSGGSSNNNKKNSDTIELSPAASTAVASSYLPESLAPPPLPENLSAAAATNEEKKGNGTISDIMSYGDLLNHHQSSGTTFLQQQQQQHDGMQHHHQQQQQQQTQSFGKPEAIPENVISEHPTIPHMDNLAALQQQVNLKTLEVYEALQRHQQQLNNSNLSSSPPPPAAPAAALSSISFSRFNTNNHNIITTTRPDNIHESAINNSRLNFMRNSTMRSSFRTMNYPSPLHENNVYPAQHDLQQENNINNNDNNITSTSNDRRLSASGLNRKRNSIQYVNREHRDSVISAMSDAFSEMDFDDEDDPNNNNGIRRSSHHGKSSNKKDKDAGEITEYDFTKSSAYALQNNNISNTNNNNSTNAVGGVPQEQASVEANVDMFIEQNNLLLKQKQQELLEQLQLQQMMRAYNASNVTSNLIQNFCNSQGVSNNNNHITNNNNSNNGEIGQMNNNFNNYNYSGNNDPRIMNDYFLSAGSPPSSTNNNHPYRMADRRDSVNRRSSRMSFKARPSVGDLSGILSHFSGMSFDDSYNPDQDSNFD